MMDYCEVCGREVETKIITRRESFNVCGEDIEVDAQVMVCAECGEELFNEELDSATLINAYNEYRRRHKLLLPEEIRKIREQYLTENEVALDEKQVAKLLDTVDKLEEDTDFRVGRRYFDLFFSRIPCEENGFKGFDYEKLCAMVLFFAHKSAGLLKTKLMKLLNYSDMIFYKENGISISGLKYAHLPYGPVPDNFDMILGKMAADHIAHIEVSYDGAYEKHRVVPECDVPEGVLSDEEIEVLTRIYEKFKNFGSAEISNYSHKETGYKATKTGQIISYAYAMDIDLN